LLIAAATENVKGTENLWSRGKRKHSRHYYPDYGKYLSIIDFKCFKAAAPYAFCQKDEWFVDKRDKSWDIFMPAMTSYNKRRLDFFKNKALAIILDESMSGFCPKTSKKGGLPHISHEPRKPVSLGTLIRNSAETTTGAIIFEDPVMQPELQFQKTYSQDVSHMPDKQRVPAATAEVLRQVDGCQLERGKSWVGGDAWFGSVATVVEVKCIHGIDSTFIVKQNTKWYPKKVLFAILRARYGDSIAGKWVVMRSTISGVRLFICVYAWSQSSVSYFVSSCGKTVPSNNLYSTKYEDEFGRACEKHIHRPSFADYFYTYCPIIDEHNKQRQFLLHLESTWKTEDPWFRLLTTLLGQSVVDLHQLCLHYIQDRKSKGLSYNHLFDISSTDDEMEMFYKIKDFADALTQDLDNFVRERSYDKQVDGDVNALLERITDKHGNATRAPTHKQLQKGRCNRGSAIQGNCYICRLWNTPENMTTWRCTQCHMPLCKEDRSKSDRIGHSSCIETHLEASSNEHYGCKGKPLDRHTCPPGTKGQWIYRSAPSNDE
jgi:hypothetical protein